MRAGAICVDEMVRGAIPQAHVNLIFVCTYIIIHFKRPCPSILPPARTVVRFESWQLARWAPRFLGALVWFRVMRKCDVIKLFVVVVLQKQDIHIRTMLQGWEFIEEKKESKKTRTRPRKHTSVHEKRTFSGKHALDQESFTKKRTRSRKNDNGQENSLSTRIKMIDGKIELYRKKFNY